MYGLFFVHSEIVVANYVGWDLQAHFVLVNLFPGSCYHQRLPSTLVTKIAKLFVPMVLQGLIVVGIGTVVVV